MVQCYTVTPCKRTYDLSSMKYIERHSCDVGGGDQFEVPSAKDVYVLDPCDGGMGDQFVIEVPTA